MIKNKTTKEIIFETSIELFSTKGYSGTSMRELARKVGIKESSLYNHYKGKGAILDAILDYYNESYKKSLNSLDKLKNSGVTFSSAIDFWMAGVEEYSKKQAPLIEPITRILVNEMFLNHQCREFVLTSMFSAQIELTESIFSSMQEQGLIEVSDVKKSAAQYVYMIQGMEIKNKLLLLSGEVPDKIWNEFIDTMIYFIEGISK